jgi:phenylalanyl-tRNA synthetase beta chain
MPVITLPFDDLEQLTGTDRETILEQIPMMGCDIERIEEEHVDIEFFPNRPDLYSVEGVARALRCFLEIDLTPRRYTVKPPATRISLSGDIAQVRPQIACAVLRNIEFTPRSIESLMNLQESLHWAVGRDRRKASIGVHDLSKVTPPFTYTTVPRDFTFIPLDFRQPMSIEEILREHPKGVKFAHLLEDTQRYPLICDAEGEVLSFPPIINSERTRVSEDTRDLFVEVTGLSSASVRRALNIVVTALAERGAVIEAVEVLRGDEVQVTPDLSVTKRTLSVSEAAKLLGIKLSGGEAAHSLAKMGFNATLKGDEIIVEIPPYRSDILHTWDLIEDIAIGYGYANFTPKLPETATIGASHKSSDVKDSLREIMIGLGYLEVMPFTLTSEKVHFDWMCRPKTDDAVFVANPISKDYTLLRTTLLPGLLRILSANQHHELPQKIFEVGEVVKKEKGYLHLAAASIHAKANYTEARALTDAILREMGLNYTIEESKDSAYIPNRCADIIIEGERVGNFGEIHPQVILNFGLENPIIAVEIEIKT